MHERKDPWRIVFAIAFHLGLWLVGSEHPTHLTDADRAELQEPLDRSNWEE